MAVVAFSLSSVALALLAPALVRVVGGAVRSRARRAMPRSLSEIEVERSLRDRLNGERAIETPSTADARHARVRRSSTVSGGGGAASGYQNLAVARPARPAARARSAADHVLVSVAARSG